MYSAVAVLGLSQSTTSLAQSDSVVSEDATADAPSISSHAPVKADPNAELVRKANASIIWPDPKGPKLVGNAALGQFVGSNKGIRISRGEFESEAVAANRFKSLVREFSFDVPLLGDRKKNFSYDSDRGVLQTWPYLQDQLIVVEGYERLAMVATQSEKRSTYVGTNAYGARRTVDRTDREQFGVVFTNVPRSASNAQFYFSAEMTLASSQAASLVNRMSWRFHGVTVPGLDVPRRDSIYGSDKWAIVVTEYHRPTFTEPWESVGAFFGVPALLARMELVDDKTGRVLAVKRYKGL
jgi:hypothetical protein